MPELLGRRGIGRGFRCSFILVLSNISYDRSVKKHGLQLVGRVQSAARILYLSPWFIFSAYCLVRVLYVSPCLIPSSQSAVCCPCFILTVRWIGTNDVCKTTCIPALPKLGELLILLEHLESPWLWGNSYLQGILSNVESKKLDYWTSASTEIIRTYYLPTICAYVFKICFIKAIEHFFRRCLQSFILTLGGLGEFSKVIQTLDYVLGWITVSNSPSPPRV